MMLLDTGNVGKTLLLHNLVRTAREEKVNASDSVATDGAWNQLIGDTIYEIEI